MLPAVLIMSSGCCNVLLKTLEKEYVIVSLMRGKGKRLLNVLSLAQLKEREKKRGRRHPRGRAVYVTDFFLPCYKSILTR